MSTRKSPARLLLAAAMLFVVACQDNPAPVGLSDQAALARSTHAQQEMAAWFAGPAREVMGLAQTVFAARDDATNQLVFGVENPGVIRAVDRVMASHLVPATAYRVEIAEPIHFASTTLRTAHRPTVGGIQIHWSQYVCTLGFNVDHSGGRSFITNSHCTEQQGTTGTTAYYQPTSTAEPSAIAIEADDPAYFRGGACSVGKVCRYSDAARALYNSGIESYRGVIAKTTGENNGSIDVSGAFTVAAQDNSNTSFGGTMHKVGRTTGWSSGNVTNTCATVNVSGSNIQLLCQTIVQRSGTQIVGGGDSGSPVFMRGTTDDVTLVGILWGGNQSGDLFVFSPLKSIQDELGAMTATSGGDTGGGGGSEPPPEEEEPCVPRGNGRNCQ